jgi:hypothetical protein
VSEISVDFSVRFSDEKIRDAITAFLNVFDSEVSFKNRYLEELKIFDEIGVNANLLFTNREFSCDIDNVKYKDGGLITFILTGGTLSGSDFFEGLIELFIKLNPDELIAVEYNSQVGELSVYAYQGEEMTIYYTSHEGDCDDLLHEGWDYGNPLEVARNLYKEGKLVMPNYIPEFRNRFDITTISGFDVKLLENDELVGQRIVFYLISGFVIGVGVFVFCSQVLGYFWTSVAAGVAVFLLVTLFKTLRLINAQEEYLSMLGKSLNDFYSE